MIGSSKKRMGIFGGSFDPPHYGHLEISRLAIKKLSLDQIYWCVTKKNPLKSKAFFPLPERIKKSKIITNKIKKMLNTNLLVVIKKFLKYQLLELE